MKPAEVGAVRTGPAQVSDILRLIIEQNQSDRFGEI